VNYSSVNNYLTFLDDFERVSVLKPGSVYAYVYNPLRDVPKDILKFYDLFPLTFITDVNYSTQMFHGINLHHMPLPERLLWFKRLSLIINIIKLIRLRSDRLSWLNYHRMMMLYRKSDRVVRQYSFKRVTHARIVPFEKLKEALQFYARTYYGVGINEVSRKFYNM
jgi:hypothetical protein